MSGSRANTSEAAQELIRRLVDKREANGWRDKDLAKHLDVTPATLSKRLNDDRTIPDEEWIARTAFLTKMSDEETAKLLVEAALERARDVGGKSGRVRESAWERIKQNIYLMETKLPRPENDGQIIQEAFEAMGITVDRPLARKAIRGFVEQHTLPEASFRSLFDLYDGVVARLSDKERKGSFGEFSQRLRFKLGVREFPLAPIPSGFITPQLPGARVRSVPLLPGILVHHMSVDRGREAPTHSHEGMEAILPLRGRMTMEFEGGGKVVLDAKDRKLLLYEASLEHGGKAQTNVEMLVVHYSSRLARKWSIVEELYHREIRRSETEAEPADHSPS